MFGTTEIYRNWRVGHASRALLGGVSFAILLSVGTVAAKADDSVTIQEIKALKAQLKALEKRIDTQAKVTQQVVRQQAAYPGPQGPYEPPQPWDKKFHLNGITITPGGYFELAGVWRSRNEEADLGSNFANIPMGNANLAHLNESRLTARGSRASVLVEAPINPSVKVSGYGELDFLGAAQTADSNEKNAYNPRIRQLWANVDWNDWGVHLLGGQTYSLVTLESQGIAPLKEAVPTVIDSQVVPGFAWKRQPGIRLTKDFGQIFWASVSAENPQTTFASACATANAVGGGVGPAALPPGGGVAQITCAAAGGSAFDKFNNFSLNHIPDIVGKLAADPTVGGHLIHVEGLGLYRDFYDQVTYFPVGPGPNGNGNYTNFNTTGWGVGGGAVVQVVPKFLDFQGNALYGRGIGSYGSGQLGDVTFAQNGSESGIRELIYNVGATVHATSAIDLYAYYGAEIEYADYFTAAGATPFYGYGVPNANNTGCNINNSTHCAGNTKSLWQITGGVWDKIYQGSFGDVRVGLQYSYTKKDLFAGTGGLPAGSAPRGASTDDQMVFASLRYYPFTVPPAPAAVVTKY